MTRIIAAILLFLSSYATAQVIETRTPFATTVSPIPNRYAYTNNGLWVDSTVKFTKYKQGSDTVLLGVDAAGKLYHITKTMIASWGSGGGGGGSQDLASTLSIGNDAGGQGISNLSKINGMDVPVGQTGYFVRTVNAQSADALGRVAITKSDISLGNVDNTSDVNKPISTATQSALNGKVDTAYIKDDTLFVRKNGITYYSGEVHYPGGSKIHWHDTNSIIATQYYVNNQVSGLTLNDVVNNGNTLIGDKVINSSDGIDINGAIIGLHGDLGVSILAGIDTSNRLSVYPDSMVFRTHDTTILSAKDGQIYLPNINKTGNTRALLIRPNGQLDDTTFATGGGGSADSSWISAKVGEPYSVRGTVFYYPLTSDPGVSKSGSFTTTYGASGLTISGGTNDNTKFIEFPLYCNYDKTSYSFHVIPTKGTGSKLGVSFGNNDLFFSGSRQFQFFFTNDADSGTIWADGVRVSGNLSLNSNDTINITIARNGWFIDLRMQNRRTGQMVRHQYSDPSGFGSGGKLQFNALGGTQIVGNLRAYSYNRSSPIIGFFGDSQTGGSGASNILNSYVSIASKGNLSRVTNFGLPGVAASYGYNSTLANWLSDPPKNVVFNWGFNNIAQGALATDTLPGGAFYNVVRAWDSVAITTGATRYFLSIFPRTTSNFTAPTNAFNLFMQNWAKARGAVYIDATTALYNGGNVIHKPYVYADAVHLSDEGHRLVGNAIIKAVRDSFYRQYIGDTVSPLVAYLPTTAVNLPPVVADVNGNLYQGTTAIPTAADFIVNNYKFSGGAATANGSIIPQNDAVVYVKGTVGTDSFFHSGGLVGARFGFNASSGTNVLLSNTGVGGIGYPQRFPTVPEDGRNFVAQLLSTANKSVGISTFDATSTNNVVFTNGNVTFNGASRNLLINPGFVAGITLGSNDNVGIGHEALSGITGGSGNNIHIVAGTNNVSGGSAALPATLTGAVIIGKIYDWMFGEAPANGEVVLSSNSGLSNRLYTFGPKGGTVTSTTFQTGLQGGTDVAGNLWTFRQRATGNATPGAISFQFSNPVASGSTIQSTFTTALNLSRDSVHVLNKLKVNTANDPLPDSVLTISNGVVMRAPNSGTMLLATVGGIDATVSDTTHLLLSSSDYYVITQIVYECFSSTASDAPSISIGTNSTFNNISIDEPIRLYSPNSYSVMLPSTPVSGSAIVAPGETIVLSVNSVANAPMTFRVRIFGYKTSP